jgi:fructokinase
VSKHTLVSWGELLWDLFPDDRRLGGAAANVAFHLARLGDHAVLVSRVGDDELGTAALARLADAGVDVRFASVDADLPTGQVLVELQDGEPSYRVEAQAAWDRIGVNAELASLLARVRAVCFGTLAQRTPLALGALRNALAVTSPAAVRVCDLNVRAPFCSPEAAEAAVILADVVKLNEAEAAFIEQTFRPTGGDAIGWLLDCRGGVGGRPTRLVALTRGARGCVLARPGERVEHPGFVVRGGGRRDTVGCGDAFTAVLAHELATHPPVELDRSALEALAERANRYAARVACRQGGMPEDLES